MRFSVVCHCYRTITTHGEWGGKTRRRTRFNTEDIEEEYPSASLREGRGHREEAPTGRLAFPVGMKKTCRRGRKTRTLKGGPSASLRSKGATPKEYKQEGPPEGGRY